MTIQNSELNEYKFLKEMYSDSYFPDNLVDKGVIILKDLCKKIENTKPASNDELFKLTHEATNLFNELQEEFWIAESEIETGARENIGGDFDVIVKAYGFDVDIEDVIATRDW